MGISSYDDNFTLYCMEQFHRAQVSSLLIVICRIWCKFWGFFNCFKISGAWWACSHDLLFQSLWTVIFLLQILNFPTKKLKLLLRVYCSPTLHVRGHCWNHCPLGWLDIISHFYLGSKHHTQCESSSQPDEGRDECKVDVWVFQDEWHRGTDDR